MFPQSIINFPETTEKMENLSKENGSYKKEAKGTYKTKQYNTVVPPYL